ncbi:retrovirus-related pol polyprotein from transposon TNT 1-94 [Tanacetum coccineum]
MNNVLANFKNSAKKVAVYVSKNKQTDNTSANVISNKENVNDVNVANSDKAKTLLCVSCMQNVLIPCHDKYTTYVVLKTRFSEKLTQSKSLDTTSVVSKPKIDVGSASKAKHKVVQIVLWIVNSGCSKHMTGDRSLHGYGTVRTLNLFRKHIDLTRLDLVDGLSKFKYGKDHLCSACERGKSKKASHPPKLVPSNHSKLELLHMDLCGPMRVASINGKKYILVIVDDYSRYTWVYFLHSKDKTPEIINKFIAQAQLNYKAKVCKIRTDNGTKFKNATLKAHYEKLGIKQQFSTARTPQQNGVVERRNRTLVETAKTMLIFSRLPEFLWVEEWLQLVLLKIDQSFIHDITKHLMSYYAKESRMLSIFMSDTMNTPSKEDLDNLFGPMFEEYFEKRSFDTLINSAAQLTQFHEDSPSTSSIIVENHEAPSIETTSDEQTSPISLIDADEFNQEDSANFSGNLDFVPYNTSSREEIKSSTADLDPSNVQNFH